MFYPPQWGAPRKSIRRAEQAERFHQQAPAPAASDPWCADRSGGGGRLRRRDPDRHLTGGRAERALVTGYVNAWARHDYARMYQDLDPASRRRLTEGTFAAAYDAAANTATMTALTRGRVGSRAGDLVPVAMRVRTRLFGTLRQTVYVSLSGSGSGARVHFVNSMVFPGLRRGELLTRHVRLARAVSFWPATAHRWPRGPAAHRRSPMSPPRSSAPWGRSRRPGPPSSPPPAIPPRRRSGSTASSASFEHELAGTPGGDLLAGRRVIAHSEPLAGLPVRTTINPAIERAAVTAMAGRYAGIAAWIHARAGCSRSPGWPSRRSSRRARPSRSSPPPARSRPDRQARDTFPVLSGALGGRRDDSNANGESCGGTLVDSFATRATRSSRRSAPSSGARDWSTSPSVSASTSRRRSRAPPRARFPPRTRSATHLAVGSSAIGQGVVQATALQMTDVAATIAMGGRRPWRRSTPRPCRASSA